MCSKSAYWKFIIQMFRSVRTLLGGHVLLQSTSTLRSWPNPLDGSLAMCWNGLLGLTRSHSLIEHIFLRICWSVVTVLCMACDRKMFLSFMYKRNIDKANRYNSAKGDRDGVWSKISRLDHSYIIPNYIMYNIILYHSCIILLYFTISNPRTIGGTSLDMLCTNNNRVSWLI